jgi:hypothetical protein
MIRCSIDLFSLAIGFAVSFTTAYLTIALTRQTDACESWMTELSLDFLKKEQE